MWNYSSNQAIKSLWPHRSSLTSKSAFSKAENVRQDFKCLFQFVHYLSFSLNHTSMLQFTGFTLLLIFHFLEQSSSVLQSVFLLSLSLSFLFLQTVLLVHLRFSVSSSEKMKQLLILPSSPPGIHSFACINTINHTNYCEHWFADAKRDWKSQRPRMSRNRSNISALPVIRAMFKQPILSLQSSAR